MTFLLDSAGVSGLVGVGGGIAVAVFAGTSCGAGAVVSVVAGVVLGALMVADVVASEVGKVVLAAGCGAGFVGTGVGVGCGEVACGVARRLRTTSVSRSICGWAASRNPG